MSTGIGNYQFALTHTHTKLTTLNRKLLPFMHKVLNVLNTFLPLPLLILVIVILSNSTGTTLLGISRPSIPGAIHRDRERERELKSGW